MRKLPGRKICRVSGAKHTLLRRKAHFGQMMEEMKLPAATIRYFLAIAENFPKDGVKAVDDLKKRYPTKVTTAMKNCIWGIAKAALEVGRVRTRHQKK